MGPVLSGDDDRSTQAPPATRDHRHQRGSAGIGWISAESVSEQPLLLGDQEIARRFHWTPSRFAFGNDRAVVEDLLASAASLDGIVISGLSLAGVESLFVLRALQLLKHQPRLDVPAVVLVAPGPAPFKRLGDRMRSGWPFRSALFVGDAQTVAWLRAEGLVAIEAGEAAAIGLNGLLQRTDAVFADMLAEQVLAVQFHPAWLYGGSLIVFSNQIEAMLDRGWFVLRIMIDAHSGPGPTMLGRARHFVEEANIDATAHLDTVACWPGTPRFLDERFADAVQRDLMRFMAELAVPDDLASELASRASIAMVNYGSNLGLALKAAPDATYVLETHDDVTCMRLTRRRLEPNAPAFPDLGTVKRHLQLERLAWRAADVCIALSLSDLRKIRRHAAKPVFVLPRPYARTAVAAGADAQWDILIVMNAHHFNIPALDRFLTEVIASDPLLSGLRIAIVGRINEVLESAWKDRLPATRWLGYVKDLDDLRDASRLSVCPDEHGTGIAIKTLTSIAARHPLVATRTALRGLPPEILRLIPPAEGTARLRSEIHALLSDDELLRQRRDAVCAAADRLWPATGHAPALDAALEPGSDRSGFQAAFLAALGQEAEPVPVAADGKRIRFGIGGNDRAYLGHHWLQDEPGGRWSDGASATVRLPADWVTSRCMLQVTFMETLHCQQLTLRHEGVVIAGIVRRPGLMWFELRLAPRPGRDVIELELSCPKAFRPRDDGINHDERVLGMNLRQIEILDISTPAALTSSLYRLKSGLRMRLARLRRHFTRRASRSSRTP